MTPQLFRPRQGATLLTRRALAAFALGVALVAAPAAALAETVTLRFVQTNDIDRMAEDDGRGGFARLAGVLAAERAKEGTTFFVHSGDSISPSLLSGIDRGAHVIDILNRMGVDVMVPGNHEFDFGPEVFRARMAEKSFDVVASNIREADGSAPAHTMDDKVVEVGGVKVAFYGLTTEETPIVATAGDVRFASSVETAREKHKALKEAGADFVVAVVHTPLAVDMMLVRENLADLVLSGHDEHLLTYFDGRTALTESYSQADYVVVTTVELTRSEKDGKVSVEWRPDFATVDTATVEPDAAIAAVVKGYEERLDAELGVEIGTTETELDSRRATVRSQEAAIGNLIADAMRAAVGADIAITNGGGIRADRQYAAGSRLTRGDILAELPFGNKTVKLELKGAAIKAALENGFSQVREGGGRFPQVSGLVATVKLDNRVGERVTAITVGGEPLDPERVYTVATNDYMAGGGDGYRAFSGATNLVDAVDATLMASQVIDFVAAAGSVAPAVEGRIAFE